MTTTAASRRGWPLTAGHGVTPDDPEGHVANALGSLRSLRQVGAFNVLPYQTALALETVDRRLELALQGIRLLIAKQEGGLHLSGACSCVLDAAGSTILPCVLHDPDDTGRRND